MHLNYCSNNFIKQLQKNLYLYPSPELKNVSGVFTIAGNLFLQLYYRNFCHLIIFISHLIPDNEKR
jgi:hypothetical protein